MNKINNLRWSKYTLPNGRDIYLTQRPDVACRKSVLDFEKTKLPIVRFNFCDDFVKPTKTPFHWLPWIPSKDIPVENVFSFISLMDFYNKSKKVNKSIWLHCDSSSMRAPTFFGLFLKAIYPNEELEICEKMTVSEGNSLEYALYSRADKYANISLERDQHIKMFINAWVLGGEELAHQNIMKIRT